MKSVVVAAIACSAVVLAGCSSTDADTPTAATTAKSESSVGDTVVFTRKGGQRVGSITVSEIVAIPGECLTDPPTGQAFAFRVEVVNDGELTLPSPDMYSVKVRDNTGHTQNVDIATINLRCLPAYPSLAPSQPSGKTLGWRSFQAAQVPSAIVYAPYVADEGSTVSDIKWADLSPAVATYKVPNPLPAGSPTPATATPAATPPPAATTQSVPPTTQPKPAPAAGRACDTSTDNWAVDSSGGQLKCANAGGATPKWVESAPLVGTRAPGSPCELGTGVAESPSGQTLVCAGDRGSATWTPGP